MSVKPSEEEDKYFAARELESREQRRKDLEKAARELEEKRRIAETVAGSDMTLAERISALGFDSDTARIFDLLPLFHVAWADGSISSPERTAILNAIIARGIDTGSEAFKLAETLLEKKPSDAFLKETLAILREMLQGRDARGAAIVDLCVHIAEASGGFFGLGNKVSGDERDTIAKIAESLGPAATTELQRQLGE